ncbi:MAG: homoserine kinase [Nocardioides sp.]|nr:homoserine kinase [Nocardioides sp.]
MEHREHVEGAVEVSVPATSANLGPGFDALGIALDLRDTVRAEVADSLLIDVEGQGADGVPRDERHLVYRAMVAAFARMGRPVPPVRLHCTNRIPHGRGLGSSSAAIVAGVVAARALVPGGALLLDDVAVLDLAADLEGHADNVAPALLGGLTVAFRTEAGYAATRLAVDPRIAAVLMVPEHEVATRTARGLLPDVVPHADAAANAGRAALLVAALTGRPELLMPATEDWLHQEYRRDAFPETLALVARLRAVGIPATVSGAGPSVLALVDAEERPDLAGETPDGWAMWPLAVDPDGARLVC